MNKLVFELEDARKSLTEMVSKISDNNKRIALVGEWNLKDLLAHLTGWANYQIDVISAVKNGYWAPEPGKIDDFNRKSTGDRKKDRWKEVYDEWLNATQNLVKEYKSLNDELWKKPIWEDKKTDLEKLIKIEINHYKKTHIPQIKELLKV